MSLALTVPVLPTYRDSYYSGESPYSAPGSRLSTFTDKFDLTRAADVWDIPDLPVVDDEDDWLHKPDLSETLVVRTKRKLRNASLRGVVNVGCLSLLLIIIVGLFLGYPLGTFVSTLPNRHGAYNIGGINKTGQVPTLFNNIALIDKDTPKNVYSKQSPTDPSQTMQLVFSDEFNTDGRSFYPGDDPYWEAVDLYYWATNDLEWYDPAAVTTANGSLVITLSQVENHNLNFRSGMIQSWNKFCFTGGYIETSVQLPGQNNIAGFWPSVWTLGNLGRAGYGATLDGMWPYSYDACDVGTVPNQTYLGIPQAATVNGDDAYGGVLSVLPGQKLSRCSCKSSGPSLHPGPKHSDGSFVGRSAPEIDIFEAQVGGDPVVGQVSQSAQWAPFNNLWVWSNTSQNERIVDPSISIQNSYIGSATQQATSVVTSTNQQCYELVQDCYSLYAFEYTPGFDNAYITWLANDKIAWTLAADGMKADPVTQIAARPISQEPMYIIMNLGMSTGFGVVDIPQMVFPAHLRVDYVRVYQPEGKVNIGCDPKDFPTKDYINQHMDAYTNANLTSWSKDYGQQWPGNSFMGQC